MNILFICSRNQWRSRTAEDLFKNHPLHQVRSAGTAPSARIKVSEKAIQWADLILVMEKRHKEILREKFGALIEEKEVMALDIPDEYGYMDPELVEILEWHWQSILGFGKR
ncbi:low molecular weight protein tyrosine phosphatase family protein [Parapedobacter indicus]|uniref:low molecular weight protein tyrosine phosphatase family protein n=1 Tax=Parapedobacter indicus TaxID=1477437 RepID=UPI000B830AB9|nr:protein tyrosine phosphatase [Parapedobacter indicus]